VWRVAKRKKGAERPPRTAKHGGNGMQVKIDRDRCIGSGACVIACPEVFSRDDEDGLVVLLDESPPTRLHDAVEEASEACPASVIWTTA
jgi:ferredoxin